MTAVTIQLQPEFGYCMLVFILSIVQLTWMAIKVGQARKKYDVKYPAVYSEKENVFNCVMRAHLNTLEGYTQFVGVMLLGGLKHPVLSAIGGCVIIAGRFAYFIGYSTGDPAKRMQGAWHHLGGFLCTGCVVSGALSLLGVI